ncbi:hypothetical protein MTR67_025484 [Solanum verrucosum]|uniref:SRR1-like domain-containing protein n=1 Tax=Solanum verrucosum TaxID=315347 RepID=A0AAF0QX93_SOLVR|nr:hypothetical protein MTR67_025484 [Solanum verrucosum]
MLDDLENNKIIQQQFKDVLGSCTHVHVVIYCLGSIDYDLSLQVQLALVLQLKEDAKWIGNIEIYDPVIYMVDILACNRLGLKVLDFTKDCKRKSQRPTMFYMSYPYYTLIGNLLGANWSSICLNWIILLTCSLHEAFKKVSHNLLCNHETMIRLQKIMKFTIEFDIKITEKEKEEKFPDVAWHFFGVDANFDTDIVSQPEPIPWT